MLNPQKIEKIEQYVDFTIIAGPFETEDDRKTAYSDAVKQLCTYKNLIGLSWEDVAAAATRYLGLPWKEGYYRKNYGEYALTGPSTEEIEEVAEECSPIEKIEDKILELRKEKIKLSDERIQNNAYIRRLAREDTLKEIASDFANKMSSKKLLNIPKEIKDTARRDAILCVSDWHYGIEVDNALNKFNPEICRQRVEKLAIKTLQHCRAYGIKHLNLLNLGDLIAGRIHLQLRLESRNDVVTQTMEVSELLAEMITRLSSELVVDYYSCIDNHSRIEPNKNDSLELETLARITDWYLKSRLASNPNVRFNENVFGPEIITLKCNSHNIAAVHGDNDTPTAVSSSIARLTRGTYDMILMAHRHHFAADELNMTVVLSNGSILGTDAYAYKLRLSAHPSQNLIIVSEDNVTESVHRILLK